MAIDVSRVKVREQDAKQRAANFDEVCLGYSFDEAQREAQRCLQCKKPKCVAGCPVNVDIPGFIKQVVLGNVDEAYKTITLTNSLPAVCGRVCPQEEQCEVNCVVGLKGDPVAIGKLERFVADAMMKKGTEPEKTCKPNGKKVAVVGAGPAGLTAAGDLARYGYEVDIFEAFHQPGGVLVYGIPEFRLPKKLVEQEIDSLVKIGVNIHTNVIIGRSLTVDQLFEEGYEAVFIGSGAGLPKFMDIPGENLNGVYSANEYLTRINLMKGYLFPESHTPVKKAKRIAVVGGGNVAMDAARSGLRMGAEAVHIVYRRSEEEMPARIEEIHHAKEEGIHFDLLCSPVKIIGDGSGWVKAIRCIKMELGQPDQSGRRRPIPVEGSEFDIEVDAVVMAIGTSPNPLIKCTTDGLATEKWGGIIADEMTGATSRENIYAGGDAVTGAATVILAMGAGKNAAQAIHQKLSGTRACN